MDKVIYKFQHGDWERILSVMYRHGIQDGWLHLLGDRVELLASEQLSDGSYGAYITKDEVLKNILLHKKTHDVTNK